MITHGSQVMCCLSEPKVDEILRDQVRRVNELFRPHPSSCRTMRSGWQPVEAAAIRKLTPGQMLAENVSQCATIVKSVNPRARIFVWSYVRPQPQRGRLILPGERLAEGFVGGLAPRRDRRQLELREGAREPRLSSPAGVIASSSPVIMTQTTCRTSRAGTRPRATSGASSASCTRPGRPNTACWRSMRRR